MSEQDSSSASDQEEYDRAVTREQVAESVSWGLGGDASAWAFLAVVVLAVLAGLVVLARRLVRRSSVASR